jgi:Tol biopolymer transport system component
VYEVTGLLGAGGMGEVYRARDTRLGRDVAIKVLPAAFASDPERLDRFEREARVLASLTHPHIAAIYGVEETAAGAPDPLRGLVLELVDGDTLAERLARGPLPIAEAIAVARQIADALEAAHEQGIVHRDLKPANIKITPTGAAKVLDFGIAKVATRHDDETRVATREGTVIGTTAYMSPEQTRGREVDRRSDIWAFGCVLFEMLTGRNPFGRATPTDTLIAIVERDPDWSVLPAQTPPHVRRLLTRCLVKDPRERLRDIGDARIELSAAPAADSGSAAIIKPRAGSRAMLVGAALVMALFVAVAYYGSMGSITTSRAPVVPFQVLPPAGHEFAGDVPHVFLTLSPDATQLAFVAYPLSGNRQLWLRSIGEVQPKLLAGTDGAFSAFWSPDGRSLAFFDSDHLKRMDMASGTVTTLCEAPDGARQRGSWGRDGTIVFSGGESGVVHTVAATGGTAEVVVAKTAGYVRVQWPVFLPDGKRFLYAARMADDSWRLMIAAKGREPLEIGQIGSTMEWVDPDYLLYAREGVLVAHRFDLTAERLVGEPQVVVQGVNYFRTTGRAMFTAALNGGGVAFHSGVDTTQLVWIDPTGREVATIGEPGGHVNARLSPDATRVVFDRMTPGLGTWDLWIMDLTRGVESRITSEPGVEVTPVWTADGRGIVFGADRGGSPHLYRKDLATGADQELRPAGRQQQATGMSPDGRTLGFIERSAGGNFDLFTMPLDNPKAARQIVPSGRHQNNGLMFSRDGRAFGYTSNRSGRYQVYAALLSEPTAAVTVSPQGGIHLRWSPDGRLVYYMSRGKLVSSTVKTTPRLEFGTPKELFDLGAGWLDYDPAPDGRFLAIVPRSQGNQQPLTWVTGWWPAR